jgi:hypothetical protein
MLFRLWGGANFRSAKDLDLEGFLQDEAEVVREVFASICAQPVEDDGASVMIECHTLSIWHINGRGEGICAVPAPPIRVCVKPAKGRK